LDVWLELIFILEFSKKKSSAKLSKLFDSIESAKFEFIEISSVESIRIT
jgi:hypothetical protein